MSNDNPVLNFNQFFQTLNRSGRRGIQAVMKKRRKELSAVLLNYVPDGKRENFDWATFKQDLEKWVQMFRNCHWRSGRVKTYRPQIRRAK